MTVLAFGLDTIMAVGALQILRREHGKTIIIVTHDPKAAAA